MIPVREVSPGRFEQITGNPVLTSDDGKERAPLQTILHQSWSDGDRARFGVYMAVPFVAPEGRGIKGGPTYEREDGVIRQRFELMPATLMTGEQKGLWRQARQEAADGRITILGLTYPIFIRPTEIQISCYSYTPLEWKNFTDEEIFALDKEDGNRSAEFWKRHRTVILTLAGVL